MNTNINSPEFWEQVKKDFENSSNTFLCSSSDIFDKAWDVLENEICCLALDYLPKSPFCESGMMITGGVLFYHDSSIENYRAIRLDFLDYMINRTRNEQPTL